MDPEAIRDRQAAEGVRSRTTAGGSPSVWTERHSFRLLLVNDFPIVLDEDGGLVGDRFGRSQDHECQKGMSYVEVPRRPEALHRR